MVIGSTVLALSVVAGLASPAGTPAASVPPAAPLAHVRLTPADLPTALQSADNWQRQMNEAEARKASGKKLMIYGGIAAVGGTVLGVVAVDSCVNAILTTSSTSCGGQSALSTTGWLISLGGDVTFVWGLVSYISANGDISSLNAQKPAGRDVLAFNLSPNQDIAVRSGGRAANVAYRVRW